MRGREITRRTTALAAWLVAASAQAQGFGFLGQAPQQPPAQQAPLAQAEAEASDRQPGLAAIDAVVEEMLTQGGPGVAVAVIHDGAIVHKKGYGLARTEGPALPVTSATTFNLASLSKAFTAMVILRLAERGAVDLDADIRKYLGRGRGPIPATTWNQGRPVRVRDLVHMTSGLTDIDIGGRQFPRHPRIRRSSLDGTNEDVVTLMLDLGSDSAPGTEYVYNNGNYCLLASIVERVTGKTYGEYLEQSLLEPLGMLSTVQQDHRYREGLDRDVPDSAQGYYRRGPESFSPTGSRVLLSGSGRVFSSLDDMIVWDRALREGSPLEDDASWRTYWTPGRFDGGQAHDYAFGWHVGPHEGRLRAKHTGGSPGFSSYFARYLDDGISVIVLANNGNNWAHQVGPAVEAAYLAELGGAASTVP